MVPLPERYERLMRISGGNRPDHCYHRPFRAQQAARHSRDDYLRLMGSTLMALGPFMFDYDSVPGEVNILACQLAGIIKFRCRGCGQIRLSEKCVIHDHQRRRDTDSFRES